MDSHLEHGPPPRISSQQCTVHSRPQHVVVILDTHIGATLLRRAPAEPIHQGRFNTHVNDLIVTVTGEAWGLPFEPTRPRLD
jgi:hypothetical protein